MNLPNKALERAKSRLQSNTWFKKPGQPTKDSGYWFGRQAIGGVRIPKVLRCEVWGNRFGACFRGIRRGLLLAVGVRFETTDARGPQGHGFASAHELSEACSGL